MRSTRENPSDKRRGRIADFLPLIRAADGMTLSQVCAVSGLEPTTVQNWIKRGYVPHPVSKKYRERHLARILLISELRQTMQIDRVGALLQYINGDTDDESDDIIPEEALYDLFSEIAERIDTGIPTDDEIGKTVRECTLRAAGSSDKLVRAMEIMAYAYLANLRKREAERLFEEYVDKEKEAS